MIVHTLGKKIYKTKQIHPFHLVDPSPWPLLAAVGAFALVVGGVSYMHNYQNGGLLLLGALFYVIFVSSVWWRDIVREATYEGQHTKKVQSGLRMGMVLFIISEIMFFFAFF